MTQFSKNKKTAQLRLSCLLERIKPLAQALLSTL